MKGLKKCYSFFLILGWGGLFLMAFDFLLGDEGFLPPGFGAVVIPSLIAALTLDVVRSALLEHLRTEHRK